MDINNAVRRSIEQHNRRKKRGAFVLTPLFAIKIDRMAVCACDETEYNRTVNVRVTRWADILDANTCANRSKYCSTSQLSVKYVMVRFSNSW